jgi:hypothetical protein
MRDVLARVLWTFNWWVNGTQSLSATWRASGKFVAAMRAGGLRRIT